LKVELFIATYVLLAMFVVRGSVTLGQNINVP